MDRPFLTSLKTRLNPLHERRGESKNSLKNKTEEEAATTLIRSLPPLSLSFTATSHTPKGSIHTNSQTAFVCFPYLESTPRSQERFHWNIRFRFLEINCRYFKSTVNFDSPNKSSPTYVRRSGEPFMMGLVDNAEDHIPGEATSILLSLASSWDNVIDLQALQVIPLKGAFTNKVYQIKWPTRTGEPSRKVLVRIYGEGVDVFFDRNDEIRTFEFISKQGQGPRLLGRFPNGRIEEFINARTLSAPDFRNPKISSLIAAKLKEFHDLDMPGSKNVILWDRMKIWLSTAKHLSSPEEAKSFCLDTMDEEISNLEKKLSGNHRHIGFCHNDLQYGNIMIDEKTMSVTLIDYEYASYNPAAFDVANHFCEMAADYHTETPHILDFGKYPGLEERRRFVHMYLSSSGDHCSEIEMEQLIQDIEKYTLASHLIWGLWGIISGHVNKIDFDYMEYARQRFQQYWLRKASLLGSSGCSPH